MSEYCVTGGTGFIASYLVKSLLHKGHTVRTTARNPEDLDKVGFLWEMEGAKERLKIFKADLLEEGSFDEAINGVDGVFHTASPVILTCDGNIQETLIDPCVKGTQNVLNSCLKSKGLKRVVLTSSCSAIRYRDDVQEVSPLNESHWSDIEYCKRYNLWYVYSKTIGEKEAWKIAKQNGIDLVVVNPSCVVGPLLAPQPTSSILLILNLIKGVVGEYLNTTVGFVHIDDVVDAHLLAMEDARAYGRLICSSSVAHWSEIVAMLRAKYPSYPFEDKCSSKKGDNNPHSMDTTKIAQLGFPPFKTIEQMFDDCIKSFQQKDGQASGSIEETLINPCVKRTQNVLSSCLKLKGLKRVVLTSFCSIRYRDDVQEVSPLNESHWTDTEYCKRYNLWYAYANTIGEQGAWKIA